jgi:hypothetical protein
MRFFPNGTLIYRTSPQFPIAVMPTMMNYQRYLTGKFNHDGINISHGRYLLEVCYHTVCVFPSCTMYHIDRSPSLSHFTFLASTLPTETDDWHVLWRGHLFLPVTLPNTVQRSSSDWLCCFNVIQPSGKLCTSVLYPGDKSTEVRCRLQLRSTTAGANNRLDVRQLVLYDREVGRFTPQPGDFPSYP